ncbi:MAG: hypothetical protein EOM59_13565, partial [Clostridia bacterium]|nr:hypothetical protein [Clostridia bacterium]
MTDFIPSSLSNQELFERVYTLKELFLKKNHDYVDICDAYGESTICLCNKKGDNELGMFLDCLYCLDIKNPTVHQTIGLAYVFLLAKNYVLNGSLSKDSDIRKVVNGLKLDEMRTVNNTTLSQQYGIFAYVQDIIDEKMSIVQQDDGKLALDKKIIFIE